MVDERWYMVSCSEQGALYFALEAHIEALHPQTLLVGLDQGGTEGVVLTMPWDAVVTQLLRS
jgi:hypothetical protein